MFSSGSATPGKIYEKKTTKKYLEHEGMVAKLPELHDGVHEGLGAAPLGALAPRRVREHDPLLLHVGVQRPLQPRHLALDDVLHLNNSAMR
jgi:hypothetical protein